MNGQTTPMRPAEGTSRNGWPVPWREMALGCLFWLAAATCQAQDQKPPSQAPAVPKLPQPGGKPKASAELTNRVQDLVESIDEAEVELEIELNHSKLIRFKQDVNRVAISNPDVIETVPFGPKEMSVIGNSLGSTTMTLWLGEEQNGQPNKMLNVRVTVIPTPEDEDRRRVIYGALQKMINELFPNSKIQLIPVADKLIVRGQARDAEEALQIMAVLQARTNGGGGGGGLGSGEIARAAFGLGGGTFSPFSGGQPTAPLVDTSLLPNTNIINLLEVPGPKQVMLKVRIAELQRSATRNLGVDFNLDIGDFIFNSTLVGGGNLLLSGTFDDDSFNLVLNALEGYGVAKVLAEPNLVTLNGQTATFISGGQFPVPTAVGVGGIGAASTSFKGFGTQLAFTPTIVDRDRIRLTVAPTFSTINSSVAVNGIPGLNTRGVVTTVDLREGQVLAIAGLIQEQTRGDHIGPPFLSKVPFANLLFSSKAYARDETELIMLVSPELVSPLSPEQAPQLLPGMEVTEPGDLELFLYGHLEGPPWCHHRSTIWPIYRDRICAGHLQYEAYRCSEDYYIQGAHGFSN